MKLKSSQNGSAHVVIIIVLIVALIGTLCFVYWQNFVDKSNGMPAKNTTKTNAPSVKKMTDKATEGSLGAAFGTKISFKYHDSWKLVQKQTGPNPAIDNDVTGDDITISSPSNKIHVRYSISNGGRGGACIPEEMGHIASISYENLKGTANTSFVQVIIKEKDATFSGQAALMKTTGEYSRPLIDIKVADSMCDLFLRQFVGSNKESFLAWVLFGDIDSKDGYPLDKQATMNGLGQYFEGDEYTQAKAVLLSTIQQ